MTKQATAQVSELAEPAEIEALWGVLGLLLSQMVHAKYFDPKMMRDHLANLARPEPPAPAVQKLIDNLEYTIRILESNKSPNFYLSAVHRR